MNDINTIALKKFAGDYVFNKIKEEGNSFLKLTGEVKKLSILMLKIQNWSSLINQLRPMELIEFLNSYYPTIFKIIHNNYGIVNNIINDQIIALWGLLPESNENKEVLATLASLQCQKAFNDLINNLSNMKNINLICGISCGEIAIGNFGSEDRLFNIVMGDYVGLSNMLMNLNMQYKTNILITDTIKEKLNDSFQTREIDYIRFSKTVKPVKIFEIVIL